MTPSEWLLSQYDNMELLGYTSGIFRPMFEIIDYPEEKFWYHNGYRHNPLDIEDGDRYL